MNQEELQKEFIEQLKLDNHAVVSTIVTSGAQFLVLKFADGKQFYFSDGEYGTIPITRLFGKIF
jgi:hypothetical protein